MLNAQKIILNDKKYLINTYKHYPIIIIRGKGVHVWDINGKKYLDFLGGIAVNILGHSHPAIVRAIIEQAKDFLHISNLYYNPFSIELAKLLVLHGGLDKVFFCNSGTEANEGAIKLARKYHWKRGHSKKYKVITATGSFHGRTLGSLTATNKNIGFGPKPAGFQQLKWNDTENFVKNIDEATAAVLLEPIQGEGGIHVADQNFLKKVRTACDQVGALLIFDEIQCGMGRCGTLFAYQSFGIKPDLITLAKGIAGGLPLGAICVSDKFADGFQPGDHGSTFGPNPVAVRAALATLKILIEDDYLSKVNYVSSYLFEKLKQLQKKYPKIIAEIRGQGLMVGIELKIDAEALLNKCHMLGLLANITEGNVLRLLPSYIINKKDVRRAISIIETSLIK